MNEKESDRKIFRILLFRYPVIIILNTVIVLSSIFIISYCNEIDVHITETGVAYYTDFVQYIKLELDNKYKRYLNIGDEIKWWHESKGEANKAVIMAVEDKNDEIIIIAQSNYTIELNIQNVACEIVIQQSLLNKIIDSVFRFNL